MRVTNIFVKLSTFLMWISLSFSTFAQDIPKEWLGDYKGIVKIYKMDSVVQSIPMEFHFNPINDSSFTWTIVYAGQPRAYTLFVVDKAKGLYKNNENNGIELYVNRLDNTLFSLFSFPKMILSSEFTFREGKCYYRTISGPFHTPLKTGDTTHEGNKIDPILSYPMYGLQKATLEKVKP